MCCVYQETVSFPDREVICVIHDYFYGVPRTYVSAECWVGIAILPFTLLGRRYVSAIVVKFCPRVLEHAVNDERVRPLRGDVFCVRGVVAIEIPKLRFVGCRASSAGADEQYAYQE